MTKEDWLKEQKYDDDFMIRLAVVDKRNTGLPMVIWIDVMNRGREETPRLIFKDSYTEELKPELMVPISIDKENPEVLLEGFPVNLSERAISVLKKWIIKHYDGLMDVWNGNISHCEFIMPVVRSYHLANGIERVFERIDYDYDTIRYSGCKHRYKFYVQGFLDGMRFMDWWKTQEPDKELFEKILSLNMYEETDEMYEINIDEDESIPLPANVYIFGYIKCSGKRFELATQGDIDKIREPNFHIYKEDDDYAHPDFDFAVSLIDIISKDEINLIWQQDKEKEIKRTDKKDCSWTGYEDLLTVVTDYLSWTPKSNRWIFNDNIDRVIYAWNKESCDDFKEKGMNPLKEYCEFHKISILEKYKPYIENQD